MKCYRLPGRDSALSFLTTTPSSSQAGCGATLGPWNLRQNIRLWDAGLVASSPWPCSPGRAPSGPSSSFPLQDACPPAALWVFCSRAAAERVTPLVVAWVPGGRPRDMH